jgi:hypothetical protein
MPARKKKANREGEVSDLVIIDRVIDRVRFCAAPSAISVKLVVSELLQALGVRVEAVKARTERRDPVVGFPLAVVILHNPELTPYSERVIARIKRKLGTIPGGSYALFVVTE